MGIRRRGNVFHTPTTWPRDQGRPGIDDPAQEHGRPSAARPQRGDSILVAARAPTMTSCCIWTSYFHTEYGSQTMYQAIQTRAQQAG